MGIAKLKPDEVLSVLNTPHVDENVYKKIFVEDQPDSEVLGLLRYMEGAPWTVTYYGQLLTEHNDLKQFDPTIADALQPYYKVNMLPVMVSEALTPNYDSETNISSVVGSALLPAGFKPITGDMFTAQVDNGEIGLFQIQKVERLTHRKNTVYSISYSLYSYVSANQDWVDSLETRVQETYYFHDNRYTKSAKDAIVTPSVHEIILKIDAFIYSSKEYYFSHFFDPKAKTFLLPNQDYRYLDPILINFIKKTVSSEPHFRLNELNEYSTNNDYFLKQKTILDAVINRNYEDTKWINKRYGFIEKYLFRGNQVLGSLVYMPVDKVIYPVDANTSAMATSLSYPVKSESLYSRSIQNNITDHGNASSIEMINTVDGTIIHKLPILFNNDYYIVNEGFYGTGQMSLFEMLITRYLKREALAPGDIYKVTEDYLNWSMMERFYYLPVLWVLAKTYLYNI